MTAPSTVKPSALVAAAHIIASDGPGEVVRKLDAAFDAAMAHRSDLPSGAAFLGTYRNVDDGATYTWGRCDDGFFRLDQFGWATWPTQEGFARALLLAAAPQAQAHEAPAALQQRFRPGKPCADVEVAWLLMRSRAGDGEGGSDEAETVVLALRGDDEQWFVAGDWRANSTLDSVHDDGGWIVGWMPYEVPAAILAAAPQAQAPSAPSGVVGDMAVLVKQLVQALRKAAPGNDLAGKSLDYLKRHGLQGSPLRVHSDDAAVDRFSAAMKAKLAAARAKGRSGWKDCHPERLSRMLREHVEKGDPRDVANFCMFLWCLGQPITAAPTAPAVDAETAKKAARYDFLRSRELSTIEFGGVFAGRTPDNVVLNGEDLDAAIDESIATADQPAK